MSSRLRACVAAAGALVTVALVGTLAVQPSVAAAAGKALLLGQDNRSSDTTTLSGTGGGPTLRLKAGRQSPALAVSNSRLVKRLNADRVDGLDADDLAPVTTRFVLAEPGESLRPGRFLSVSLPAGSYLVTGSGTLLADDEDQLFWSCVVGTSELVRSNGTRGVLTGDLGRGSGGWSIADVVSVTGEPLVVGCHVEGAHQVATPGSFTFRRVGDVVTGQAQPVDLSTAR